MTPVLTLLVLALLFLSMSLRVSVFLVPSGAYLMAVPVSKLGRVKLS